MNRVLFIHVEGLGDVLSRCIIRNHNLFCQTEVSLNGLYYLLLAREEKRQAEAQWVRTKECLGPKQVEQ